MEIFIRCESLPSVREICTSVLVHFIVEKLLSTEAVETGIVKQIEATCANLGIYILADFNLAGCFQKHQPTKFNSLPGFPAICY